MGVDEYAFRRFAVWSGESVLRKEFADGREKTGWRFAWRLLRREACGRRGPVATEALAGRLGEGVPASEETAEHGAAAAS